MKNRVSTVINYCTNDHKFLYHCIDESLKFSREVVVSYTTHMYDNSLEDVDKIEEAKERYSNEPRVIFNEYEYDHNVTESKGSRYWHNHARYTGWNIIRDTSISYCLFLDVDEIVEGTRFYEWLINSPLSQDYYFFKTYWYFRDERYQAIQQAQAALLIKNEVLSESIFYTKGERRGMIPPFSGIENVQGLDGTPMFHHYSWVRTENEMLRKVKSWGHVNDKDWVSDVREEFSHDFDGTDFIHGYQYKILKKPFKEIC